MAPAPLDVFGNRLEIGALSGFTSVTNSHSYFDGTLAVTGTWTVDGAEIASGAALRLADGVALDWGASACIVVANARALARETDYAIVVSESTLPATLPSVEATDDSERFRLVRSADGLTLTLRRVAAATVLIME